MQEASFLWCSCSVKLRHLVVKRHPAHPLKLRWKRVLFRVSPGSQLQQRKPSGPTSSCIPASGVRKQTRPTEAVRRRTSGASIRWNAGLLLFTLQPFIQTISITLDSFNGIRWHIDCYCAPVKNVDRQHYAERLSLYIVVGPQPTLHQSVAVCIDAGSPRSPPVDTHCTQSLRTQIRTM